MNRDQFIELSPKITPGATRIKPGLINEYLLTEYRVDRPPQLTLRIGEVCDELKSIYTHRDIQSAAFITAFNPYGQSLTDEANDRRHAALEERVALAGHPTLVGAGHGRDPAWMPEKSLLILGITLESARDLGDALEQNAIVFVRQDAIPRLILLV